MSSSGESFLAETPRVDTGADSGASQSREKGAKNREETNSVGTFGSIGLAFYLVSLSAFLLYGLVQVWPHDSPAGTPGVSSSVTFLVWTFSISDEVRLFLIVAMAGALGSLIHSLRSAVMYIGNKELKRSWLALYVARPWIGASLAIVFYVVIRGGFFSPQSTVHDTSPFAFAAVAGLVGLFSEQALERLKQVAENLFSPAPKAKYPLSKGSVTEEGKSSEDK